MLQYLEVPGFEIENGLITVVITGSYNLLYDLPSLKTNSKFAPEN